MGIREKGIKPIIICKQGLFILELVLNGNAFSVTEKNIIYYVLKTKEALLIYLLITQLAENSFV